MCPHEYTICMYFVNCMHDYRFLSPFFFVCLFVSILSLLVGVYHPVDYMYSCLPSLLIFHLIMISAYANPWDFEFLFFLLLSLLLGYCLDSEFLFFLYFVSILSFFFYLFLSVWPTPPPCNQWACIIFVVVFVYYLYIMCACTELFPLSARPPKYVIMALGARVVWVLDDGVLNIATQTSFFFSYSPRDIGWEIGRQNGAGPICPSSETGGQYPQTPTS